MKEKSYSINYTRKKFTKKLPKGNLLLKKFVEQKNSKQKNVTNKIILKKVLAKKITRKKI